MSGLMPPSTIREQSPEDLEAMKIAPVENEPEQNSSTNPKTGAVTTVNEDGSVTISYPDIRKAIPDDADFDANLCDYIDETSLDAIASDLLEGIDADIQSRADWDSWCIKGVEMLGLKLEDPQNSANTNDGSVSRVHHTMLLEAVVRYQANFLAEMLPSEGPAKIRDDTPVQVDDQGNPIPKEPDELASAFEKDYNHYLTVTDSTYVADTDKMAFSQGLYGNGFKKVYHDPLLRRPVSRSIKPQDLIVSNDATDLESALRVTHRTYMSHSTFKRMVIAGEYRDIDVGTPNPIVSGVDSEIAKIEGVDKMPRIPADFQHTIYETLVDLDLTGFEHSDKDGPTGLPLPYVVTIEKDSRKILAIRRNWDQDDTDFKKRLNIIHYPFIPGLGFYAYGLLHLLGMPEKTLTGVTRMLLDAGQFSCFPGAIYGVSGSSKQTTTDLRVAPGTAKAIDIGANRDIRSVFMSLPYKEPSAVLLQMAQGIEQNGMRLAGAAQVPVGEGRADVPVGTIMAAIEQTTKVIAAVHKRNHNSMQRELIALKQLFSEDPTALSRFSTNPNHNWQEASEFANMNLVPASDPNVPSNIHRIMVATALIQLMHTPAGSDLNGRAILNQALSALGVSNKNEIMKPEGPKQGPNPQIALKQQELALKAQDQQLKQTEQQRQAQTAVVDANVREKQTAAQMQNAADDRKSKETLALLKLRQDQLKEQGKNATAIAREHLRNQAVQQPNGVTGNGI